MIGSLSAAAIAEDIAISDADIRIAFEDNLDEFRTPETRDIRQLVFDDKATATPPVNNWMMVKILPRLL